MSQLKLAWRGDKEKRREGGDKREEEMGHKGNPESGRTQRPLPQGKRSSQMC